MKKRGQVRRAGDSRLEDQNVAVEEIVQIQRRMLELGGLDATWVDVSEICSFRIFKEERARCDRPQLEKVVLEGALCRDDGCSIWIACVCTALSYARCH